MMKKVLSLIIVFAMLSAFAVVPALSVTYEIKGDSIILAAHDSTIKLRYLLLEGDVETEADWSIESRDPAHPGYLAIDSATGDLYVSKNALGKTFKVIASIEGSKVAEKQIAVADKHYYEDFDNETIDSTELTSSLFSQVSNAKVISRGEGLAVQYTGTTALYNQNSLVNNPYPLAVTMPAGFAPESLTIESKAKIAATVDDEVNTADITSKGKTFAALGYEGAWRSVNAYVASSLNATQARYGYKSAYTNDPTNSGTKDADLTYNDWVPVKVSVKNMSDYFVLKMTVNEITALEHRAFTYTSKTDKTMNYELSTISFGSDVDDIEIYSGEKTDYNDFLVDVIADIPENIAIGEGNEISRNISVTTIPADADIEWESDNSNVYIENNRLFVSEGASGNVELKAVLFKNEENETTKNFMININEAVRTDFENETAGGNIIEEASNLYFEGSETWNVNADGGVLLSAKIKGNGKLILLGEDDLDTNDDIEINCDFGDNWKKVFIFADTVENTYMTVIDGEIAASGEYLSDSMTGGKAEDLCVDDLYVGSAFVDNPFVLDVSIEGIASIGQTVSADYKYFSSSAFEKENVQIGWFVSENENEIGNKVSSNETFKIKDEYAEKFLRVGIKCSDENGGESVITYSVPNKIQDLFTVTELDGKIKFDIINPFEEVVYPFAVLYSEGSVSDICAMKLPEDFDEPSFELPVSGYTGAVIYLLDGNFIPLSGAKTLGIVPDIYTESALANKFEEKNGVITLSTASVQQSALFIMKPSSPENFESSFSFDILSEKIQSSGTSLSDYLAFAGLTETGVSMQHSITDTGAYTAVAVLKDGQILSHLFSVGFNSLFEGESLKNLSEESFIKIMKNFTDIEEATLETIFEVYSDIQEKDTVTAFLRVNNFDVSLLETAVYLSAFLENKEMESELTEVLTEKGFDAEPIELMAQNSKFDLTKAELPAPCKIKDYLKAMKEKAILLGIKNATDYNETKIYLCSLNSDKVTESMAIRFTGKAFSSIAEVEEAILSYIPEGDATLIGNTSIFLPPVGKLSANEYILKDSDGNEIADAVYSLDGEYEGVTLNGNKLIIDGSKITILHKMTLTASSLSKPDISGKLTVSLQNLIYFEDFEDATEASISEGRTVYKATMIEGFDGTTSSNLIHSQTTSTIAKEENGNKYAHGTGSDKKYILAYYSGNPWVSGKITTVAAKIKFAGEKVDGAFSIGNGAVARISISEDGKVVSNSDKTGAAYSVTSDAYVFEENVWTEMKIVLDYRNFTYDLYAGDILVFDDFSMVRDAEGNIKDTFGGLERFYLQYAMFDDVLVCSGELITTDITADIPEYIAISSGKEISQPINSKTSPANQEIEWISDNAKVYVKNDRLIVSEGVSVGSVLLKATIFKGTEHETTKNFTVNIAESVSTDFESETPGSNIYEEGSNLYFSGNGSWNSYVDGKVMLSARVKGSGKLVLNGDKNNIEASYNFGGTEWHDVFIYADTYSDTYISVADACVIDEGEFTSDFVTRVSTDSLIVDDIYMGTAYISTPVSLDTYVNGIVATGQTVSAGYRYFSPAAFEEKGTEYTWFVSDSESEQGICVSTEKNFKIESQYADKYLRVGVKCSDGIRTAEINISEPVKIEKLFTVAELTGKIEYRILNPFGNITIYPFAVLYNGNKICDIRAMCVDMTSSEITCQLPVGEYTGAVVYLLSEEFAPLSEALVLGTVPEIYTETELQDKFTEENGVITLSTADKKTASLFVFKPNVSGSFSYAFSVGTLSNNITETGRSLTQYLAFAGLTDTGVSMNHYITESGVYNATAIFEDGKDLAHLFGVNFSALFENESFKSIDESSFVKIMSNFTSFKETELKTLYSAFNNLSDKDAVAKFMKAENYKMSYIKEAVYIPAFLENTAYKATLTSALSANGFDTKPVELMAQNSRFDLTKAALSSPCKIKDYLNDMKEKAILLGVEHAVNYAEAKEYLIATGAGNVTDTMALDLMGNKYTTLDSLNAAINNYGYQDSSSGSSGGSSGGGGSSIKKPDGVVIAPQNDTVANSASFTDISQKHWAYEYVNFFAEKKIINGYSDGSFMPEKNITRAEFVKIICMTFGLDGKENLFTDVSENDWYYPYICAAYSVGVISGDNGYFRPNDIISRQEAAVVLHRVIKALDKKLVGEGVNAVSDIEQVADYAQEAVKALNEAGIITGMDTGEFCPGSGLTRAQAAAILFRTVSI